MIDVLLESVSESPVADQPDLGEVVFVLRAADVFGYIPTVKSKLMSPVPVFVRASPPARPRIVCHGLHAAASCSLCSWVVDDNPHATAAPDVVGGAVRVTGDTRA